MFVWAAHTSVYSNMKALHLFTQQMALDGLTAGDTNLGWPGDHGGSFSHWARQLVPAYLKTDDFAKLLSVSGKPVGPETLPLANTNGILIYAVTSNSPASTVLFSTANFTNTFHGGLPLHKESVPYGDKGFMIFRMGGDGAILKPDQVGDTNLIGGYAPYCH